MALQGRMQIKQLQHMLYIVAFLEQQHRTGKKITALGLHALEWHRLLFWSMEFVGLQDRWRVFYVFCFSVCKGNHAVFKEVVTS